MEKIEKILLLAVLGVALLIVGVMAFLPKDIESDPGDIAKDGEIYKTMSDKREGYLSDEGYRTKPANLYPEGTGGGARGEVVSDAPGARGDEGSPATERGGEGAGAEPWKPGSSLEDPVDPLAKSRVSPPGPAGNGASPVAPPADAPGNAFESPDSPRASIALTEIEDHPRHPGYAIYRVRSNDSLSSIVQAFCVRGEGTMDAILKVNERLVANPDRLREGEEIMLPKKLILSPEERAERAARRVLERRAVEQPRGAGVRSVDGRRAYAVQQGESLWVLATRDVGTRAAAKYIQEVRRLNPGLEPKVLRAGSRVYLPSEDWVRANSKKR